MKIGLVLGAGGIQGGAWLTGGLDALAEETGWDPAAADYVIGTSAGSMIGAIPTSGSIAGSQLTFGTRAMEEEQLSSMRRGRQHHLVVVTPFA